MPYKVTCSFNHKRIAYGKQVRNRKETEKVADDLAKRNPYLKFEVRQLGKLDQ